MISGLESYNIHNMTLFTQNQKMECSHFLEKILLSNLRGKRLQVPANEYRTSLWRLKAGKRGMYTNNFSN